MVGYQLFLKMAKSLSNWMNLNCRQKQFYYHYRENDSIEKVSQAGIKIGLP